MKPFCLLLLLTICSSLHGVLYLDATYEGDDILENRAPDGWRVTFGKETLPHMITVSTDFAKSGKGSVKFDSRIEDPAVANCPGRAELAAGKLPPKGESWTAYSFLFPEDQKFGESIGACIGQWHGSPDRNEGENWRNPFFALHLHGSEMSLDIKGTDERIHTHWQTKQSLWTGTVKTGVWYTFVLHINWDWSRDGDGFMRAWMSSGDQPFEQIANYKGQIGANDQRGPYFKWGIYNWKWKHDKREHKESDVTRIIAYYDDVRIGGPDSSFKEMTGQDEPAVE